MMKKIFTDVELRNMEIDTNTSKAYVWVIDGDCLYDEVIPLEFQPAIEEHDEVLDVSDEYPEYTGLAIRFMKNGEEMADLLCSEYFGSILLSNPQLVNLADYPYGRYVESPNARFDGEKFIILNRDVTGLPMWVPGREK